METEYGGKIFLKEFFMDISSKKEIKKAVDNGDLEITIVGKWAKIIRFFMNKPRIKHKNKKGKFGVRSMQLEPSTVMTTLVVTPQLIIYFAYAIAALTGATALIIALCNGYELESVEFTKTGLKIVIKKKIPVAAEKT
jgi:hypothetical protein